MATQLRITELDRVELNSRHIDWLIHERIDRANASCAVLPHRLSDAPNLRLSIHCQAGSHTGCIGGGIVDRSRADWRCWCLCHYAGDQ